MKVLCASTGRSGTGWVAAAARAGGLTAGHEACYSAIHPLDKAAWARLDVEASMFAGPHLATVDVPVLHLVRHPESVARSFAGIEFWSTPSDYLTAAKAWGFRPSGDSLLDGFRWWTFANRRIAAHAATVMRIEDAPDEFADVMNYLGCPLPFPAGVAAVPNDVNHRPQDLDSVVDAGHPAVVEALELSTDWGYK